MTEAETQNLLDYRTQLQVVADKSSEEFEKRLLYISTGALGLSFSFITDIVELKDSTHNWILISGWVVLALCILINLMSHHWSKSFAEKAICIVDDCLRSDKYEDEKIKEKVGFMNQIADWTTYGTILLLFLGIVAIIVFAAININQ